MYSKQLRITLTDIAKKYASTHKYKFNTGLKKTPESALIFDQTEFNFNKDTWSVIWNNTAYRSRTQKAHSSFDSTNPKDEMQSSNSSDALLMNIFCYPKINEWKGVKQLLQVNDLSQLKFGHEPGISLNDGTVDRTEVDLFIQDGENKIFCESKLTETDFVFEPLSKFERYTHFDTVFDSNYLPVFKGETANYQLVRNILAAYEFNTKFYLFIDARRPDLAKSFYQTLRCIKDIDLRQRCEIFYWQDIAAYCGADLKAFLMSKYGINESLNDSITETHPDWYQDIPEMKYLILGSFPPHEDKWDYPFYYPNSQNSFWKLLAEIAGEQLLYLKGQPEKAVEERVAIMTKLKAGVQNLGYKTERKGKSAKDTDISIVEFQDILSILKKHPELETIILPGFSANDSTFKGFLRYLKEQKDKGLNIEAPFDLKPFAGHDFTIKVNGKSYLCFIAWSTSTATIGISYDEKLEQLKKFIQID